MQIVVTNELNSKNHESLKVLSKNANTDDIHRFTRFAQSFTEPGDKEKADAVLQVSVLIKSSIVRLSSGDLNSMML